MEVTSFGSFFSEAPLVTNAGQASPSKPPANKPPIQAGKPIGPPSTPLPAPPLNVATNARAAAPPRPPTAAVAKQPLETGSAAERKRPRSPVAREGPIASIDSTSARISAAAEAADGMMQQVVRAASASQAESARTALQVERWLTSLNERWLEPVVMLCVVEASLRSEAEAHETAAAAVIEAQHQRAMSAFWRTTALELIRQGRAVDGGPLPQVTVVAPKFAPRHHADGANAAADLAIQGMLAAMVASVSDSCPDPNSQLVHLAGVLRDVVERYRSLALRFDELQQRCDQYASALDASNDVLAGAAHWVSGAHATIAMHAAAVEGGVSPLEASRPALAPAASSHGRETAVLRAVVDACLLGGSADPKLDAGQFLHSYVAQRERQMRALEVRNVQLEAELRQLRQWRQRETLSCIVDVDNDVVAAPRLRTGSSPSAVVTGEVSRLLLHRCEQLVVGLANVAGQLTEATVSNARMEVELDLLRKGSAVVAAHARVLEADRHALAEAVAMWDAWATDMAAAPVIVDSPAGIPPRPTFDDFAKHPIVRIPADVAPGKSALAIAQLEGEWQGARQQVVGSIQQRVRQPLGKLLAVVSLLSSIIAESDAAFATLIPSLDGSDVMSSLDNDDLRAVHRIATSLAEAPTGELEVVSGPVPTSPDERDAGWATMHVNATLADIRQSVAKAVTASERRMAAAVDQLQRRLKALEADPSRDDVVARLAAEEKLSQANADLALDRDRVRQLEAAFAASKAEAAQMASSHEAAVTEMIRRTTTTAADAEARITQLLDELQLSRSETAAVQMKLAEATAETVRPTSMLPQDASDGSADPLVVDVPGSGTQLNTATAEELTILAPRDGEVEERGDEDEGEAGEDEDEEEAGEDGDSEREQAPDADEEVTDAVDNDDEQQASLGIGEMTVAAPSPTGDPPVGGEELQGDPFQSSFLT